MKRVFAAVLTIGAALAGHAHAQQPPQSGNYFAESILTAVEGSCGGARVGETVSGIAQYQGANGTTATFRTIGSTGLARTVYTITGGAGTTTLTGTFLNTTAGNPPVSGQFRAQLGYFDKDSVTVTLDTTNGVCAEESAVYLVRTGALK